MTKRIPKLWPQIRANAVALISLAIAVSTLGYTTWRNERTEQNRNTRVAAFEVLRNLGELQFLVNQAHFGERQSRAELLRGWGQIALVNDLAVVLPPPVPAAAQRLRSAWERDWQAIAGDTDAVERVSTEIDAARESVLFVLRQLR